MAKDPKRTSKIKSFINKYNWEEINFLSHKNNWKKFETNNKMISYTYNTIMKK